MADEKTSFIKLSGDFIDSEKGIMYYVAEIKNSGKSSDFNVQCMA